MTPADPTSGDDDAESATRKLVEMVNTMLASREVFLARARAWISSPDFAKTYEDLHPEFLIKALATLMGGGSTMRMRSAKLKAGYERLATEGQLLFAGVVIGNSSLSQRPDFRCPAAVVSSWNQDVESVGRLVMLGQELAEAYSGTPTGRMPACAKIVADDKYQALRRRPLPLEETRGLKAELFDIRVSANELFGDPDAYPFAPLIVHPDGGPFAFVPWAILHGREVGSLPKSPPPLPKGPPPLPNQKRAVTPGGSVVLRHEVPDRGFEFADMSGHAAELIGEHVREHLGPIASVFHELISDRVHLDVNYVDPTPERHYFTLITSGMSDLPMTMPPGAEKFRYAELMLCLPPNWKLGRDQTPQIPPKDFGDELNYWPVRWLKRLARFPHDFGTWLCEGHTIPNGDPPELLAEGLPFTGFMLRLSNTAPDGFHQLSVAPEKTINFYSLIPLTTPEMNFKLQHGADALMERLDEGGVTDLIDVRRKSVV